MENINVENTQEVIAEPANEPTSRSKAMSDKVKGLFNTINSLTDEEKAEFKKILGITNPVVVAKVKGSRTSTSLPIKRTDKERDKVFAKQMNLLIDSLPAEPTSLQAWTDLALKAGLVTNQEPIRITAYYKKQIIEMGFAEEVKN